MAGKLQKEDFKTEAEIIASGGAKSQLLNDTQIYVTANSVNKTLDDAIIDGDIGSGGGGVPNYITNGDAETNTTGWSLFDDGAVSVPVNGTGGSSSTLTLTRTTTSGEFLSGAASFKLAKSAADGQGEGVSYDFTVDRAGATSPTKISFNYQTTANFSYTNKDIVVYIYDVTASVLIQPTPYYLDGSGKFVGEFQTNVNTSTSYRLIFMVATTNATAYDFIYDNVVVYPNQNQAMTLLQDKEYDISSYVVNSANVTGVLRAVAVPYKTKSGIWRMRFNIQVTQSSNSYCVFTITGITLNSSFSATTGQAFATNPNAGYTGAGYAYSTNTFTLNVNGSSTATQQTASGDVELDSMPTWAVDYYPVSLSDGAETRIVYAEYYRTTSASVTADNIIDFDTKVADTHAATTTGASWKFTAPVSGYYHAVVYTKKSTGTQGFRVWKNGTAYKYINNAVAIDYFTAPFDITMNAGDYFDIRPDTTATIDGNASLAHASTSKISVARISGPATVAASETVYMQATGDAASASSGNPIIFPTSTYDSHAAYSTSTGRYTVPSAGVYKVYGYLNSANSAVQINIYKNASSYSAVGATDSNGECSYAGAVNCVAGDLIDIRPNGTLDVGTVSTLCIDKI